MSLSDPAAVMNRLSEIEADLAERQNELETAAMLWFRSKRDREKAWAAAFIAADGTDGQRRARATDATATIGKDAEAVYEAHKAVCRVLDTRAAIGMSILRAQSRIA